jgi:hypothetical protein
MHGFSIICAVKHSIIMFKKKYQNIDFRARFLSFLKYTYISPSKTLIFDIYIPFMHMSYHVTCKTEKCDIVVFELQKYHTLMSYVIEYKIIR